MIIDGKKIAAKIREDLTFTVYNLFPDYFYPGKIIGTKVEVLGEPDEDKTVLIELYPRGQGTVYNVFVTM